MVGWRCWLAAGLATLLPALPGSAGATTFRAADNQVEDYPTVQALMFMDRYVQEKTGGRHRIQIFHSGQLGDEKSTIDQTKLGAIDLDRVNIAPLTGYAPVANALLLPFLFRSTAHLHAVLDGPIGDEILGQFGTAGLVGLTFYDSGARSIYNDARPIQRLADLAGLKIRIQASELMADLMTALGARPIQLSYGLVLTALQAKVVDGAENNWPSYVTTGHHRFARHLTLTEHVMSPEVLLMSRRAWDALSADDQAIFRAAAKASSLFMRERWLAWEASSEKQAAEAGSLVVRSFDRSEFERATQPVRDKYLTDPAVKALAERIAAVP